MSSLRVITFLSKKLPSELARRAALLHELRHRSATRFPTLSLPYLTRKGLSQATSEVIARWRAERLRERARGARTLDATCGIGADSVALALAGIEVLSADLEWEHLLFTRANLEWNSLPGVVLQANATGAAAGADLCLIDPDRRSAGRRQLDPAAWSPSLADALGVARRFGGACLKLAPALDPSLLMQAEAASLPKDLSRRREWVSRAGELVELCLWTGCLASGDDEERIATHIGSQGIESHYSGSPERRAPLSKQAAQEVSWIADPDPALLRSGLLGRLARELNLAPLAAEIAYLGGSERPLSPFLRAWRVLASAPLDRKKVRAMLREHDVGPISVRQRGHPESPEALIAKFSGSGTRRGHLLIARLDAGHRAYLVHLEPPAGVELVGDEGFEPPTSSL